MSRIQMQMQKTLGLALVAVALAGCGDKATSPPAGTGTSMQAIVDEAARTAPMPALCRTAMHR